MKPDTLSRRGGMGPWIALGAALGLAVGLSAYTFVYARGLSYLSSNPSACANCHVMRGHYVEWAGSSHHAVANCNDCHVPHEPLSKYANKALNGLLHATAFTSGRFSDQIRMRQRNARVTEGGCRYCHAALVEAVDAPDHNLNQVSCLHCHSSAGHMDDLGVVIENPVF